ncbi:peptidase [Catenulispora subtropica]|uniref:Peptidase S1 domain-containing protein n=1 Tax=Catenulispora subtropica TaxID=450798 RepID=A0ABP5D601_9ACTN
MRRKSLVARCGVLAAGLLAAVAAMPDGAQARAAAATAAPVLTDTQIAALSPEAQALRLAPLRAVAEAVGAAGRSTVADVYGNLVIDANHDLVTVYLTDPAQAKRVLAAARAVDPRIDGSLIRFRPAAATHAALDEAAQRVVALADAGKLPVHVDMVGPAPDASGLELDVDDEASAARAFQTAPPATGAPLARTLGVPLVYRPGHALQAKSWSDVKWHDSAPFIGGDAITGSGSGHGCTAGLPAVRKSDGHPIMVTAAHCFGVGTKVYTRAGTPGSYSNGLLGNYVGTVTARVQQWDAETIDGADNNADESDTSGWMPLTSVAYSYNGDYVCHDGQRSFFMGHPTPCNIKVTNQDKYCGPTTGCPGLSYTARGVWGDAVNNGWGAAGGDSGATMFAVESGGVRQARGLLSDGTPGDGTPGVFWTEATDIFGYFGLTLNPRT